MKVTLAAQTVMTASDDTGTTAKATTKMLGRTFVSGGTRPSACSGFFKQMLREQVTAQGARVPGDACRLVVRQSRPQCAGESLDPPAPPDRK